MTATGEATEATHQVDLLYNTGYILSRRSRLKMRTICRLLRAVFAERYYYGRMSVTFHSQDWWFCHEISWSPARQRRNAAERTVPVLYGSDHDDAQLQYFVAQIKLHGDCCTKKAQSNERTHRSIASLKRTTLVGRLLSFLHRFISFPPPAVSSHMLRTFCSNPALGGFGSESSSSALPYAATPDAFCQIIKELVDNAVDACTVATASPTGAMADSRTEKSTSKTGKKKSATPAVVAAKRVRVVIERFEDGRLLASRANDGSKGDSEILRVTVSDNGCGMSDIQACVGAFHSSKAHNTTTTINSAATKEAKSKKKSKASTNECENDRTSTPTTATFEAQTAGRYGIGLTLCLLHAQRLVLDSCASIQSAVPTDKEWTVVTAVVDTASDTVRCLPRESLKKGVAAESGTAISILVPVRTYTCSSAIDQRRFRRGL